MWWWLLIFLRLKFSAFSRQHLLQDGPYLKVGCNKEFFNYTILLFFYLTNRINFFWIWLYRGWGACLRAALISFFVPNAVRIPEWPSKKNWGWRHNIQVNTVYLPAGNWLIYMHWFQKLTVMGFSPMRDSEYNEEIQGTWLIPASLLPRC